MEKEKKKGKRKGMEKEKRKDKISNLTRALWYILSRSECTQYSMKHLNVGEKEPEGS